MPPFHLPVHASRLFLILILILIPKSPCFAWDDDEFESKPFHSSNLNQRSSPNDYGYKNRYQANTTFTEQQRNSLKVESIQDAQVKQNRWHEEYSARSRQMAEEQDQMWGKLKAKQEAYYNELEARRWRDVETVAGAFVASGPYYKAGQQMVQTDKGLVYSTGNGCVVAPGGFYFRTGNLWVGPNGKIASESGSGNNQYIWASDGDSAIAAGRGYFTERGYSWPAYTEPVTRSVTSTMRKP